MTVPTAPGRPAGDVLTTLGEMPAQPELFAWSDALHALPGSEQKSFGSAPGSYNEKFSATWQVIAAAPEPPKRMQLRGYRAVGS